MKQITLTTKQLSITVLTYGAILQKIMAYTKTGEKRNVCIGFENVQEYKNNPSYFGATVGRFAGRITNGTFTIANEDYILHEENGVHLHGGKKGLNQREWKVIEENHGTAPFVSLEYLSPHLEEGYPGNVTFKTTYQLKKNELHITYQATTDKSTPINLTNHTYFSLDKKTNINHYELYLAAKERIQTDNKLLPTGIIEEVRGTALDFNTKKNIEETQLDTPYVLENSTSLAASVRSYISGIELQVRTNQPALVVYTPNDSPSICFEAQHFPDAPNQPNFPNTILHPNKEYRNNTIFTFLTHST